MEPFEVIHSPNDNSPFAVCTRLGWCIYGSTSKYDRGLRVNRISVSNIELEKMLTKLYNNEFGDLNTGKKGLSIEDKQWLEIVESGCRRVEGGRYEIPLPVRLDIEGLPETKPHVVNRSNSLSGKLKRNKVYYSHYCDFMKGLLDKGCVEVAQDADESDRVWYLPRFGVYHPNKPDKIRVVHGCAARVQMMFLNDTLLQDPDLMNKMIEVLLRFRLGSNTFIAAIEGMFLKVQVPSKNRDMLRFIWWENGDLTTEPKVYRMTAHPFGAKSSSCANFALRRVVRDVAGSVEAKETIMNNFYVDDCLKADGKEIEMIEVAKEVKEMCNAVGFNLTKFVSTNKTLECELSGERDNSVRENCALRLGWDVNEDKLYVKLDVGCHVSTKRELLSIIASIYDPLGIASPIIMTGKVLLQTLCRLEYPWDQRIHGSLFEELKNWLAGLHFRKSLKVSLDIMIYSGGNVDRVNLTCSELQRGKKVIVHHVQWQFYTSAIGLLSSNQKIKRNSSLVKLSPILVDDILRVGGRLQMSELSFEEEHPIILPSKCHVTTLIFRHFLDWDWSYGKSSGDVSC